MSNPHRFKALVIANTAKDHLKMIERARPFFEELAAENRFAVDFTDDPEMINVENLSHFQIVVMLQRAPFEVTPPQQKVLQDFIESGKGWVGIHAAGLTGKGFQSAETPYWQWFEDFLGGVTYSPHPAYQKGTVLVEDQGHPATKNLPASFEIFDEWYEFDKSPRGKVRVLATADESTYTQNKPMGDHPVIWTNERYRRAIYIAVGHDPSLLSSPIYRVLLRDSLLWAGSPEDWTALHDA
ncbi:MAG: ThuA domain-containing protein [Armatimonadota bacterium]